MTRKRPSEAELIEDSHHVLYEAEQLSAGIQAQTAFALSRDQPSLIFTNSLLEAFVMHVRALIEFTYPKNDDPRDDDVAAVDFVPDWPIKRPAIDALLSEVKRRADKEMMHITRKRSIAEDGRRWQIGQIHAAIANPLGRFVELVPDELVVPDFRQRLWTSLPDFARPGEAALPPPAKLRA